MKTNPSGRYAKIFLMMQNESRHDAPCAELKPKYKKDCRCSPFLVIYIVCFVMSVISREII